jgi:hypothetical protein
MDIPDSAKRLVKKIEFLLHLHIRRGSIYAFFRASLTGLGEDRQWLRDGGAALVVFHGVCRQSGPREARRNDVADRAVAVGDVELDFDGGFLPEAEPNGVVGRHGALHRGEVL